LSNNIIRTVQTNTSPDWQIFLTRDGKVPKDKPLATASSVVLILKEIATGTITNAAHQTCAILDVNLSEISYTPQTGDIANAGKYEGEVKVTYPSGRFEIWYDQAEVQARQKN
jgi:hypothetical protein